MSEKYSTEELVDALEQDRGSFEGILSNNEINSIIARLLAWENLREVIRKAIADYEGEK